MGKHPIYPAYKASGIEWLGEIPSHWTFKPLKYAAVVQPSNVDKKSENNEQPVLLCNYTDVYNNERIDSSLEFMRATATPQEIKKFLIAADDVIITKDSESAFDIAVPALVVEDFEDVLCGYHLTHIRPVEMSGKYLFRLFQSTLFNAQFVVGANGVTRFGLPQHVINNAAVPLPPLPEQEAIARFLDHKTAQIDALIAKKETLLARLADKRTALISRAVTQGLDPSAPMRDSGIEWLGEIPVHWTVQRLGWITEAIQDIDHKMPVAIDDGIPFLSAKDLLDDGSLNFTNDVKLISEEDFEYLSRKIVPRRDDIIYSRIGAKLGKARLVETDIRFLVSYSCCVIRPKIADTYPAFLSHLLDSEMLLAEAKLKTVGIGVPDLGLGEIAHFSIPLPPLSEQESISHYLDREVGKIRSSRDKTQAAIDKLKEYRTALITHAVTGKIDVRGWVEEQQAN